MPETNDEIRGVFIEMVRGRVLLPNATLSEVIILSDPDPVPDVPGWLLGRVPWRGWRVPLISFATLTGAARSEPQDTARVCVLKSLGNHRRLPFVAMLAQGFPRLARLSREGMSVIDEDEPLPSGVLARVRVGDDDALIPDMGEVEEMIADALHLRDVEHA